MNTLETAQRASGILLHPTSLPGSMAKLDQGSGDLGQDAYRFVDWLAQAGQRLWQVLPLGEVGPGNSPYMSCSAFAGNVQLIDLMALHEAGWLSAEEVLAPTVSNPQRINFAAVSPYRLSRLQRAAERFLAQATPAQQEDFSTFCAAEAAWLDDYALFKALAENGQDWFDWTPELAWRDASALEQARRELASEIHCWKFCQWCFDRQWAQLKAYANDKGIQIIGDMPIFVAHHSADVWANPALFDLDEQGRATHVAGVPPDYFSANGQRWGNPLYRWSIHENTGYAWWIARVRHTLRQTDLVRIDHFRGFAAFWSIPSGEATAIHGEWVAGPGAKLFTALTNTFGDLPIIAEDLGIVTPDVTALREQFQLPGMKVLQFAFGETADHPFLPHTYTPNTVAYTGTHDNDTLLGWWQSAAPREKAFAQHYFGSDGRAIHWDSIRCLSASVAQRVIFPMQDVLGLASEHRMNFPGQAEDNWAWRFTWDQFHDWHATTLAHIAAVHGRCDLSRAQLPD